MGDGNVSTALQGIHGRQPDERGHLIPMPSPLENTHLSICGVQMPAIPHGRLVPRKRIVLRPGPPMNRSPTPQLTADRAGDAIAKLYSAAEEPYKAGVCWLWLQELCTKRAAGPPCLQSDYEADTLVCLAIMPLDHAPMLMRVTWHLWQSGLVSVLRMWS